MLSVLWSEEAIKDLSRIAEYIDQFDYAASERCNDASKMQPSCLPVTHSSIAKVAFPAHANYSRIPITWSSTKYVPTTC